MKTCCMCGSVIPDNQGSNSCSMCYGDIDHGRDGYYRDYMERQEYDREPELEQEADDENKVQSK